MEPYRVESEKDLRSFAGGEAFHRVTLYATLEPASVSAHADELRVRAAVDAAVEQLRKRGVRDAKIDARVAQLEEVRPELRSLDASTRTLAWLGDGEGWAWAPLVEPLPERVVVAPHFALRPLLWALRRERPFRVLCVSTNRVAAYRGDARGLQLIPLGGVPGSLEEALGSELEGRGGSYRNERPVPGSRAGAPIHHGHGGAPDERARDRERFHRVLARALEDAWRDDPLPIVLAAETRTAAELRRSAELPGLLDDEVRGNPDDASPDELHAKAWPLVQRALEARDAELADAFGSRGAGKALRGDLEAIAQAALAGRVLRLWVERDTRVPGAVDPASARIADPGGADDDVLDALVAAVIERGGEIRAVDDGRTPSGDACCAELR